MAKAKVVHSDDAVLIKFLGNPKNPEPGTAVIEFPGGHVEVSRTTDGRYWAHVNVKEPECIRESRIDYNHEGYMATGGKMVVPNADKINHIAVLIGTTNNQENQHGS